MKIASYRRSEFRRVGAVKEDLIYDLESCITDGSGNEREEFSDVTSFIAYGDEFIHEAEEVIDRLHEESSGCEFAYPLDEVEILAPLPNPGKLFCIAGNYADHILEGDGEYPGKDEMVPRFFLKPSTAVISTAVAIRIPPSCAWADWEVELAVVIGKAGWNIPLEKADRYISGYTVVNDVSARELSFREDVPKREGDDFFDWLLGKWLDTFAPMGPWISTESEVPDPNDLEMKLWVNDELHQQGNSGQMIFNPRELVSFISEFVTVEPGDIISTGTPAGVGYSKEISLTDGDALRCKVEGIGTLENTVKFVD